jgi:adenosylcobinamide amidohydrolase
MKKNTRLSALVVLVILLGCSPGRITSGLELSKPSAGAPAVLRDIRVDQESITACRVMRVPYMGFDHKTLVVDFDRPMTILSTLEGWRNGIRSVGNHYAPLDFWAIGHGDDLPRLQADIPMILGKRPDQTGFLFTGADMDHLSVQTRQHGDMRVSALVTAGVRHNAQRSGRDTGDFEEPGTINILLISNRFLTPRCMSRALITATEAKTACLQDLDIRSSYSGIRHQATGTGTDNIIVVQGHGPSADNSGGHSKLGELIARAVEAGVRESILQQNGLKTGRDMLHRLEERRVDIRSLFEQIERQTGCRADEMSYAFEQVLEDRAYAGFLAAAFSVSDAFEAGLVPDLRMFEKWCAGVASAISGKPVERVPELSSTRELPHVIRHALDALFVGICQDYLTDKTGLSLLQSPVSP